MTGASSAPCGTIPESSGLAPIKFHHSDQGGFPMTSTPEILEQHRRARPYPRRFLPSDARLESWESIAPFIDELEKRPVDTREQLERWLEDLSELQAAISEEYNARYIAMTCRTDDPALEQAYLDYLTHVIPRTEPRWFALNRKYLASPARAGLPRPRYFVYDRARQKDVELFREENVPLQTEDETLAQQYQKAMGEQSVEFQGERRTIPQLARLYEETDRELRREAWCAATGRQLADREAMESLFDRMVELRDRMARNAGFANYLEFQFQRLGRFDYGPAECREFHEAVEKHVMPLRRVLRERRRERLGLDRLTPWDLDVDPEGRPPIRPFQTAQELVDGTDRIFAAVDPSFSKDFRVLRDGGLLDLENRPGKAPGGYQSSLDEVRLPFIFMNATGRNQDVFTLLHEGGHAFHALACRDEPLHSYRGAPIEFCEVASMGMEMMACERLEAFYPSADARRARAMHLEDIVILLPWIARVDAFQHWIYTHPGHTRQERAAQWLELERRFGDDLDWPMHAEWRECSWIAKLHFFCVPLYYIEYGIAQLGALQLWERYLDTPREAVAAYRAALSLGNSRPLPELFEAAGLRFAFGSGMIAPLMNRLADAMTAG